MTRTASRTLAGALSALVAIALAIALAPAQAGAAQQGAVTAGGVSTMAASDAGITVTRVNTGKLTMKVKGSYALGAKASGKLVYKSSKPKVVKVSKAGKLKALKKGKAVITIKVKGTKLSKKVKVTVVKKAKFKAVKKIAAKASKTNLNVGDAAKLSVSFTPAKASNKNLIFSSSNANVAAVSESGTITAKAAGKASIKVVSAEKKKASATINITVAASKAPPAVDPRNSGVVDTRMAARGQDSIDTTLEESTSYNQITVETGNIYVAKTADIVYQSVSGSNYHTQMKLDLIKPTCADRTKLPNPLPLIIWINGGDFKASYTEGHLEERVALAERGYAVASIEHRVTPTNKFPAAIQDVRAAVRYLKTNARSLGVDAEKIAVAGDGSGGYLAAMAGLTGNISTIQTASASRTGNLTYTTANLDGVGGNTGVSSAVKAVIDIGGMADLTLLGAGLGDELEQRHHTSGAIESLFINGAASNSKGNSVFDELPEDTTGMSASDIAKVQAVIHNVAVASPLCYIDENDPAFLIVHGEKDTLVSPVGSKMLENRLRTAGVPVERIVVKGAQRGDDALACTAMIDKLDGFLQTAFASEDAISTEGGASDVEAGKQVYKNATDIPTLEESVEGAIDVEVEAPFYNMQETASIPYKIIGNKTLIMDVVTPTTDNGKIEKRPTVVFFNGGGFTASEPSRALSMRKEFAKAGFTVASVQHRVVPDSKLPEPIQDAKAAIRYLKAHTDEFGVDPDNIIALGSSAGGYFVSMLGALSNTTKYNDDIVFDVGANLDQDSSIKGVINLYGVTDLTIICAKLDNYYLHDDPACSESLLLNGPAVGDNLGGSVFQDYDYAAIFSPFTYMDKDDPSFLIMHGTNDTMVCPVATMEEYKHIKAAKPDDPLIERYSIVGAGHGGAMFDSPWVYETMIKFVNDVVAS